MSINGMDISASAAKKGAAAALDIINQRDFVAQSKDPVIDKACQIIEKYLSKHNGIIFGGMAFRLIVPEPEIQKGSNGYSDYDVYMQDPERHANAICNQLHRAGIPNVEGGTNLHYGTYKIHVDFVPLLDIHGFPKFLFNQLLHESIVVNSPVVPGLKIRAAGPDWLRLQVYGEYSRSAEDPSRWPKLSSRLALLNKHWPLQIANYKDCRGATCNADFGTANRFVGMSAENIQVVQPILEITGNTILAEGMILLGMTAMTAYVQSQPSVFTNLMGTNKYPLQLVGRKNSADYDILSENIHSTTKQLIEQYRALGPEYVRDNPKSMIVKRFPELPDILPAHNTIILRLPDGEYETIVNIYDNTYCFGYVEAEFKDETTGNRHKMNVAALPTMLAFMMRFIFIDTALAHNPNYQAQLKKSGFHGQIDRLMNRCKIICAIEFLLDHQSTSPNSPFYQYSTQCQYSHSRYLKEFEKREIVRKYKARTNKWVWRAPKKSVHKKSKK